MNPPKQKSKAIKGTKCKVDLLKRGNQKKGDIKISHRKKGEKKNLVETEKHKSTKCKVNITESGEIQIVLIHSKATPYSSKQV